MNTRVLPASSRPLARLLLLGLLVVGFLLPVALQADETQPLDLYQPNARVNVSSLNLRSGPHASYTAVAYLVDNQGVVMVGRNRGATWAQIELPNGFRGWVNARYLTPQFPVSFLPLVEVRAREASGLVTAELLYVFRGPGYIYRPLLLTQPGDRFPLLGRDVSASWYYVALGNGQTGWVPVTAPLLASVPIRDLPIAAPFAISQAFALSDHYQLYIGPGYAFQTQAELAAGQHLIVVGRSEDNLWLRVRLPDGTEGWVDAAVVSMPLPVGTLPAVNETPMPITPSPTATLPATATPTPSATPAATAAPVTATPVATATPRATVPPAGTPLAEATPTGIPLPAPEEPESVVPYFYIYADPQATGDPIAAVDPGQVIVLLGRTADGEWVQIRVPGGETGWLRADVIRTTIPVDMLPVVEP